MLLSCYQHKNASATFPIKFAVEVVQSKCYKLNKKCCGWHVTDYFFLKFVLFYGFFTLKDSNRFYHLLEKQACRGWSSDLCCDIICFWHKKYLSKMQDTKATIPSVLRVARRTWLSSVNNISEINNDWKLTATRYNLDASDSWKWKGRKYQFCIL